MEYIAVGAAIIVWLACLVGAIAMTVIMWQEDDRGMAIGFGGACIVGWIGFTALIIYLVQHPDNRPCVRYETTYQYNAALKMSAPVTYCAQYGE